MLHPLFAEEHEELRASVRALVEAELAPHAVEWEGEGRFPDRVFKRMGDLGFLGVRYPLEYGGQGGDWDHAIALAEELARCGSAGVGWAWRCGPRWPSRPFGLPAYAVSSLKSGPKVRGWTTTPRGTTRRLIRTTKGGAVMAYQPEHMHEPAPADPDRGSPTGYAAIKYTAIIIIVLAIIAFLVWALTRFFG